MLTKFFITKFYHYLPVRISNSISVIFCYNVFYKILKESIIIDTELERNDKKEIY